LRQKLADLDLEIPVCLFHLEDVPGVIGWRSLHRGSFILGTVGAMNSGPLRRLARADDREEAAH
jgi:hypothetical protein